MLDGWDRPADRSKVIEAVGKLLREAASKQDNELTGKAVHSAIDWLDEDAERWSEFIDSVEWHFGAPDIEQVRGQISEVLARRPEVGHGLAAQLVDRLVARVLVASSQPRPEDRVLDSDGLTAFLREAVGELAQWADSRQGRRIREAFSEALGIDEVIGPGTRPLPSGEMGPGRLLMAAYEVVAFDEKGRRDDLQRLANWCRDDRSASVQLITGEGGTGKTRLLIEWCKRLRAQGWHAGFLGHQPPENWCSVLLQGRVPRLVVVDYAETRGREVQTLVQRLAGRQHRPGPKLRLVLLARREADWWRQLAARSAEVGDLLLGSPDPYTVAPLVPEARQRPAVYGTALETFADARNVEPPRGAPLPNLAEEVYDRILYLQAAALVTVLSGEPAGAGQVFHGILQHENRFWQRQAEETVPDDQPTAWALRDAMPRFVTAATLIGGVPVDDAARGLVCEVTGLVPGERDLPGALLRLASRLYGRDAPAERGSPDAQIDRAASVEPLEPDLLGEQLVATTLDEDLLRAVLDQANPDARRSVLTVLTRLAQNRPAEPGWLKAAFDLELEGLAEPAMDVAVSSGDPVGSVLAEVLESAGSPQLIERLMQRCDSQAFQSSVPLRELAAVATRRTLDERRSSARTPTEADLAVISALANNLGVRYSELGRREEALEATNEAVEIRRKLARARPDAFLQDLAASLGNLGNRYSEVGRHEEALKAASEAVEHYRKLAEARPDAFLPNLAGNLNNLGNTYGDLGRREEALEATSEGVDHYRKLAAARPDAFLPDLAGSLNNLGIRYSELGRREEALEPTREAVEHYRKLAEARPDAFLPDLAASLNNLGAHYSELGRREEALQATSEAVEIRRKLAEARPDAFLPDLAMGLNNLGIRYSELGRREEALEASSEAVEIRRILAEARPDAFLPNLATSLNNLGNRYSELGRREEALEPTSEAVEIRRKLAEARPDAFLPDLAASLGNLGNRYSELGRREEALEASSEGVEHYRKLAEARPDAFLPDLAFGLNNLGIRYSELGRREEALKLYREAVSRLAGAFARYPAALRRDMAGFVGNYLRTASELGQEPDQELIEPILAQLQRLEDEPDDKQVAR